MAKKGNSRHIKSLASPKYMAVHKKEHVYVAKPLPGRHSLERCMPLSLAVKKIGIAKTGMEIRKMIKMKGVFVNGIARSSTAYPVGLGDMVSIPKSGETYSIGINERGQATIEKMEKSVNERIGKIVQKYKAPGNEIMIRLHDGTIAKSDNGVSVNDSIVLDGANKVKRVLKLGEGSRCLVIDGVHSGRFGIVKKVIQGNEVSKASVVVEGSDGAAFDTLLLNIMVVE
ncbi:S4 domain-containing protein [Candidatus Marsarchaeota archaeon]|jgi:small subunit ribosomal protein S4e|nr:S4 domain-containing protein [Candidatus Marsarchaeota archaeon]